MALETAATIAELNPANPIGASDAPSTLDDHIRLLKTVLQADALVEADIGTNVQAYSATLAGIAAGTTTLGRNKIINGGFSINQRLYASGAAVGAGLYGHDRWKMAASGDTYTFSTTANKTTVTIPAGKVLQQVIEGLNLQSGTYCLSWEGTAQGKIGAGSLSASGVTESITGGTNTTIEFGPGTVANVQLEVGSVATPFETRSIGTELALCQRYYWRISQSGAGDTFAVGACVSTTSAQGVFFPPNEMRVKPTLETTGTAANYRVAEAGANVACSAIPGLDSTFSPAAIVVNFSVASGLTAGRGCHLRAAAAAHLAFLAEL